MSKLKEFAEFLLEVVGCGGYYQHRPTPFDEWTTRSCTVCVDRLTVVEYALGKLRLKPKEEEKKKIPLELCDITPNMIFKGKGWFNGRFTTILEANCDGVALLVSETFELTRYTVLLKMEWQYSTDNGKTWKGCYKYEN